MAVVGRLPGRVSPVKRRLALTAGALVAALSFSSCSTFDHNDVAATVNGHELTRDQLDELVEQELTDLAAERATADDIANIEEAYAGMKAAIELGGDYVTHDLRFHQGLLRACHNRMVIQMSKALGALLRTAFELSTSRPDGPATSLPLHRAVLDAVIERAPAKAERAILVLIDGAGEDIEAVLHSRRKLPSLAVPAPRLKARPPAAATGTVPTPTAR